MGHNTKYNIRKNATKENQTLRKVVLLFENFNQK